MSSHITRVGADVFFLTCPKMAAPPRRVDTGQRGGQSLQLTLEWPVGWKAVDLVHAAGFNGVPSPYTKNKTGGEDTDGDGSNTPSCHTIR